MKNTRQVSRTVQIPAPIRGLNTETSLAAMKSTDAVVLENVVCRPSSIEVRKGWQAFTTGFSATVETLIPYQSLSGSADKLFAAAGTGIFDATVPGTVGSAVVSGLTSARWSHTQLSNVAGNYLILVNGADAARIFDGTTWGNWSATGISTSSLSNITVWKRRVWAVEKNSFKVWYGATDAIAGALTALPLAGVFRRGGRLVAAIPWTVDAGDGVDDYLMFVSSEGEVAVYRGTDPASASTFSLNALYYVGAPVGERFWAQFGGDILMLTVSGLISFSSFLQSATIDGKSLVTDRIRSLITREIQSYGSTWGWEVVYYPTENLLFLQVPAGAVGSRYQYLMNTLTGAWSKILQSPVVTYAVFNEQLYAGHGNRTALSWQSGGDNGVQIYYKVVPAFQTFGTSGIGMKFNLGRVLMEADYVPTFQTKLLRDYDTRYSLAPVIAPAASGAVWDSAIWDSAIWGGAVVAYSRIYSLSGYARSATLAFEGSSAGETVRFNAFEYVFEAGGPL